MSGGFFLEEWGWGEGNEGEMVLWGGGWGEGDGVQGMRWGRGRDGGT